jgi:hypothetical protein
MVNEKDLQQSSFITLQQKPSLIPNFSAALYVSDVD